MKAARRFLFTPLILLVFASVSIAHEKAEPTPLQAPVTAVQAKAPVTLQAGDYELVSLIFEFAPGAGVPRHMHGGKVLVLVLSGEMTLREKGRERVIKTGESWTEDPGREHSVVNAVNTTARVAVNMILPKGAEATTIIKK